MKIAVCNELFQGWPIAEVFEYAARLGYGGVEIAPFTVADSVRDISSGKRKEIRRLAEDLGIEIVGLHWLLVKPEGLYINHPDPEMPRWPPSAPRCPPCRTSAGTGAAPWVRRRRLTVRTSAAPHASTTTTATIWLSGGTSGTDYDLLNRIVTAGGRTEDRTITIRVEEM